MARVKISLKKHKITTIIFVRLNRHRLHSCPSIVTPRPSKFRSWGMWGQGHTYFLPRDDKVYYTAGESSHVRAQDSAASGFLVDNIGHIDCYASVVPGAPWIHQRPSTT
jgi:hypothetical protein